MSGTEAWINKNIQEVKDIVNKQKLTSRKVIACKDDFTEERLDRFVERIQAQSSVKAKIDVMQGAIHQLTLPSGSLVEARDKWIDTSRQLHELYNEIDMAQKADLYWLRHRNDHLEV